jgi:hypothetical protein
MDISIAMLEIIFEWAVLLVVVMLMEKPLAVAT